ncbi:MAG: hypothetical protein ABIT20_16665 [Gemmatimonadaceae bacterium]
MVRLIALALGVSSLTTPMSAQAPRASHAVSADTQRVVFACEHGSVKSMIATSITRLIDELMGRKPLDVGAMRFCLDCGGRMSFDKPRGLRIVDPSERVLFMSAGTATTFVWATPQAEALNDLDDTHLAKLDVATAASATQLFGTQYANGLITVTLNEAGTNAWKKAVAIRATKP